MTLHDQLVDFARSRGGRLRYGPQDLKPKADTQTARDPWIDYTDDYSLWCRTRRGE